MGALYLSLGLLSLIDLKWKEQQFFTYISNKALNLAIIFIIPPIKNRKLDPLQVKILKK